MGRTKKPCPGCGEVDRDRKSDEVCDDCKRNLIVGRRLQESVRPTAESIPVFSNDPDYPKVYAGRGAQHKSHVLEPLCELFRLVGKRVLDDATERELYEEIERHQRHTFPDRWYCLPYSDTPVFPTTERMAADRIFLISPEVLAKFREVAERMREEIKRAFAEGEASGRNMLKQLASGKMTVSDFNSAGV